MQVMRNAVLVLTVVLPLSALASDGKEAAKPVRGVVALGPEQMAFQPCNSQERWWIASTGDSEGKVAAILNAQPSCDLGTMPCKEQRAYVEAEARVSRKGKYGHMGGYSHEIYFTKIQTAARDAPADCK
jgi:hypothetical protein